VEINDPTGGGYRTVKFAIFQTMAPQMRIILTPPMNPAQGQFRVVVDVGHSAEVPGAMSARGVPEYEFNLRLATQIGKSLTGAGFARTVVLVTPGPARRGLFARVARAADLPADLFLSIHHDSVPERFLQTWTYDGKQNRFSDHFRGHSIFMSYDNPEPEASLRFARLLGIGMKARGLRYTPHYAEAFMQERRRALVDAEAGVYRYDQLIVLKDTRMPAVLLEAGSIVNRDEEVLLASPGHQSLIGAAVTDAVKAFCAWRAPQKASPGARGGRAPQAPRAAAPAVAPPPVDATAPGQAR
jgi:N-acetylmuramoyl-L-alanine amidase